MKALAIFILILVAVFVLQFFFKSLRYDFVKGGGGLSSSVSKEEAIERGVYICDLEFVSLHTSGIPIDFDVKEAWVEKMWRSGAWYWTTRPEKFGYQITLHTSLTENQKDKLHLRNDRMSGVGGYEGVGCFGDDCMGTIKELPESDTLRYNLLQNDNIDFSEGNIIGEMILVLKRN